MSDSLVNFATTGKMNFKGLVTSILSDLAKMEMRIAMSKILQQVVGMFAGSYGAEGTNSTSSIGTDSSGGSINFISHVGGRASGGPVSAGSMYEVAEGGRPELLNTGGRTFLMMGSQGGDVTPAKRGGSSVASGGNTININTSVSVDSSGSAKSQTSSDSSDAMARALAAQMEAKAKEVVMRATQPGGILWKQRVGA